MFGNALISFPGVHEPTNDARFGGAQGCIGNRERRHAARLLQQGPDHLGGMFRQTTGAHRKHAPVERGVAIGKHIVSDIPFAFQRRIEHRIIAIAHQVTEEIERRHFRVVGRHTGKGKFNPGHLGLERKRRDAGFGLRRFLRTRPGWQLGCRQSAKARFHRLHQRGGVKIADRDKNHIVGYIPGFENPQHVLTAQFGHRFLKANDRPAIGVLGERQLEKALGNLAVGIVFATPEFFEDDFFFPRQFIGVK